MQIDGSRLVAVLERQKNPIRVFAADSLTEETVQPERAVEIARTWRYVGCGAANRVKYLRLREVPVGSGTWRGRYGTRPMRADQTCKVYAQGQLMGDPDSHREFIPIR